MSAHGRLVSISVELPPTSDFLLCPDDETLLQPQFASSEYDVDPSKVHHTRADERANLVDEGDRARAPHRCLGRVSLDVPQDPQQPVDWNRGRTVNDQHHAPVEALYTRAVHAVLGQLQKQLEVDALVAGHVCFPGRHASSNVVRCSTHKDRSRSSPLSSSPS
jgi:hypothetical protein